MAHSAPWSVKGIDPQARDAAKDAARKAGMTLGAWLNTVIADQAADDTQSGREAFAAGDRLADVSERLARFARERSATALASRGLAPHLDPRDLPGLDEIVARISERSLAETRAAAARTASALDSVARWMESAELRLDAGVRAAADRHEEATGAIAQALFAIGARLDEIERRLAADPGQMLAPRWHEDAAELRSALDTVGESLAAVTTDAAEKRATEPLMSQERAARSRLDAAVSEIRRRQLELETGPSLGERFAAMSRKLDERPVRRVPPPKPSLGEEAIVARLEALSQKIDEALRPVTEMPIGDVVSRLDRLDEKLEHPTPSPELARIEAMIHALTTRIEEVRSSETDKAGLDALERQIGQLAERIDAAGAARGTDDGRERMESGFATLERTLADVLAHVRTLEEGTAEAIEQAAQRAAEAVRAAMPAEYEAVPAEMGRLRRDLADLKTTQAVGDLRAQDTLEAVHATLERIVDRLALLEDDLADDRPFAASGAAGDASRPEPEDVELEGLRSSLDALLRAHQPSRDLAPDAVTAVEERGDRPQRAASFGLELARAASAAAAPAAPAPAASRAQAPSVFDETPPTAVKASFIAAARRAAQAAAAETAADHRPVADAPAPAEDDGPGALRADPRPAPAAARRRAPSPVARLKNGIAAKRKPLLIGLAAIVIAIGAAQILGGLVAKPRQQAAGAGETGGGETAAPLTKDAGRPATLASPALPETPAESANPFAANPFSPDADPATTGSITVVPGISAPDGPATLAPAPAPDQSSLLEGAAAKVAAVPAGLVSGLPATGLPAPLRQAALKGDAAAVYEVASRIAEGRGAPRDLAKAASLFEAAASAGLVPAQYRIASHYEKGIGVARDIGTARQWYEKAAEAGNAKAMHNLGVLYAEGVAGKPDYETAVKWFRKAAELGVRDSQFNLAVLLARGLGTERDLVASYTWLSVLARDGDKDAAAKREDLARTLTPAELALAREAVARWRVKTPDVAANEVPAPAGGWEKSAAAAPVDKQPRKISRL